MCVRVSVCLYVYVCKCLCRVMRVSRAGHARSPGVRHSPARSQGLKDLDDAKAAEVHALCSVFPVLRMRVEPPIVDDGEDDVKRLKRRVRKLRAILARRAGTAAAPAATPEAASAVAAGAEGGAGGGAADDEGGASAGEGASASDGEGVVVRRGGGGGARAGDDDALSVSSGEDSESDETEAHLARGPDVAAELKRTLEELEAEKVALKVYTRDVLTLNVRLQRENMPAEEVQRAARGAAGRVARAHPRVPPPPTTTTTTRPPCHPCTARRSRWTCPRSGCSSSRRSAAWTWSTARRSSGRNTAVSC